jgi:ethanolamine kinase
MEAFGGPCVLAHCDLQEGNWIQCESTGKLYLIDYEYACYSFRGFDTGNLFCEHTFDYSLADKPGFMHATTEYPSIDWQRKFLCEYANQVRKLQGDLSIPYSSPPPSTPCDHSLHWQRTSCSPHAIALVSDEVIIQTMAKEARMGIIASHLYWTLWSIVMGAGKTGFQAIASSDCGSSATAPVASGHSTFDYVAYGVSRFREYQLLMQQLVNDGVAVAKAGAHTDDITSLR